MTTEARLRSHARAARWRAVTRERRFRVRELAGRSGLSFALSQALANLRLANEWRALAQRRDRDYLWFGASAGFLVGVLLAAALYFTLGG